MGFRVEFRVKTDVGIQRSRNEDSYFTSEDYRLMVVADGMGGHLGGDIASRLSTTILQEVFDTELADHRTRKQSRKRDGDFLKKAIQKANTVVFNKGNTEDHLQDMGTTVVATWFRQNYLVIASVGDSRVYRIRDGVMTQLTIDHSWVGELLRRKLITQADALNHPLKNIITRALGMDKKVSVDIAFDEMRSGDRYLACTDGLTDFVDDERILDIINETDDMDEICERLIEIANFIAGADNITVGIARVTRDDDGGDEDEETIPDEIGDEEDEDNGE